ncbi:peptide-methionine (S)-S-oxide reductase MsrA [Arcicella rigui]
MKSKINLLILGIFTLFVNVSCGQNTDNQKSTNKMSNKKNNLEGAEVITLGAGCFWCVEAIFQQVEGVLQVESGYSGGLVKNPTYKEVCTGMTGHAEVVQVSYDPKKISFDKILEIFWKTHDPTTLNRQGADEGPQYRSAVFYHNEAQKATAEAWKAKLNAEHVFPNPIVTEITPFKVFYPAEDYHQDYYELNGHNPYCQVVIKPKLDKFLKVFKDNLKKTH